MSCQSLRCEVMRCRVETSLLTSLAYHLDDELVEKSFESVAEAQKAIDSLTQSWPSRQRLTRTPSQWRHGPVAVNATWRAITFN
jgi:hypothetical protein